MTRNKTSADWKKEWNLLRKREERWLSANRIPKHPIVNRMLEGNVPPKLQETLESAFLKAFSLVFEKGNPLLERTFSPQKLQQQNQIDRFSAGLHRDRRSLKVFSQRSARAGAINLALSGAEALAFGALGVGIPDIPVFTALLLRSLYEMACHFGFPYDTPEERCFLLKLIEGAMYQGDELYACDHAINHFIDHPSLPEHYDQKEQLAATAQSLSRQLLYTKFLQGIPLVGVAGGTYDVIFLHRIQQYARIKYQRRLLLAQRKNFEGLDF